MDGDIDLLPGNNADDCCKFCHMNPNCVGYVFDFYHDNPGVCILKNKLCPAHKNDGFYNKMASGVVITNWEAGNEF